MAMDYYKKWFHKDYAPATGRVLKSSWYSVGVDVGVNNDNTVIVVMDQNTREQVFFWRFCPGDSRSWNKNYEAMEYVYNYFKTPLRVDCTGSGSSIPYEMPRRGVALEQWGDGKDKMKFSAFNKPIIMDNLASLIGGKHIKLFNLPEIKNELTKMQRNPKPSGAGFAIEAPKGAEEHDDIPIAIGLACMNIKPVLKNNTGGYSLPALGSKSVWMTEEW